MHAVLRFTHAFLDEDSASFNSVARIVGSTTHLDRLVLRRSVTLGRTLRIEPLQCSKNRTAHTFFINHAFDPHEYIVATKKR